MVQEVVSCLVSMFADAHCLFQYLEAMEVRPRFPMPCHHRRNGSGHANFYVQPFLDGGKVLFFVRAALGHFPIRFAIVVWLLPLLHSIMYFSQKSRFV